MGFKNDGYDYSQHMKVMGGGAFIGKDGGARPDAGNFVELPSDALPSVGELDRRLEAVTISHNLMDDDLRAALFDEDDGNGAFEELLDDFITDVSTNTSASTAIKCYHTQALPLSLNISSILW